MQKALLTLIVTSSVPLFSGSTPSQLGPAAAAYQAKVQYQIKQEEDAQHQARADHKECPRCSQFDRTLHVSGEPLTGEQRDRWDDVCKQFPHMPHDLVWNLLIGKADWLHRCACKAVAPLYEADVKAGQSAQQDHLAENHLSCHFSKYATVQMIQDLKKIQPKYRNFCIADFYQRLALNKRQLAGRLAQDIPLIPVIDGLIAGYAADVPVGFTAGQMVSLQNLETGRLKEIDLSRTVVHSAAGIEPDDYNKICLHGNHITRVKATDFEGHDFDVFELDLSDNLIDTIDDEAFMTVFKDESRVLQNVTLNLRNNRLTRITVKMLKPQVDYLWDHLDLSGNQISEIEGGSLSQHKFLKELDLSNNQLTTVPEELFAMEHLEAVNLNGNPLTPAARQRYLKLKAKTWQNKRSIWDKLADRVKSIFSTIS